MSKQTLEETLHQLGYRLTAQRLLVLSAIQGREDHFDTEEIYTQVQERFPHMNISTVYRTLELLRELGVVTQTSLGDGRIRYHWTEKGHHHHLRCLKCGRVIDLEESFLLSLKEALWQQHWFRADLAHLVIVGHCQDCAE